MFSPHSPLAEGLNVLPTLAASSTAQALAQLSREQHPAQPLHPHTFRENHQTCRIFHNKAPSGISVHCFATNNQLLSDKIAGFQSIFRT